MAISDGDKISIPISLDRLHLSQFHRTLFSIESYLYKVMDHNLHLRLEEVYVSFLDQLFYKTGLT